MQLIKPLKSQAIYESPPHAPNTINAIRMTTNHCHCSLVIFLIFIRVYSTYASAINLPLST